PFYVEELAAGDRAAVAALPASLREILGVRLASLAGDALSVVRAASVIGARVPHDRLTAVTDLRGTRLTDALRGAIDAGILVPDATAEEPGVAFRHALLREAAHDELLPSEQVRLHGLLATHLAERLSSVGPDDPVAVSDFAVQAYLAHDQPRALEGAVRA